MQRISFKRNTFWIETHSSAGKNNAFIREKYYINVCNPKNIKFI